MKRAHLRFHNDWDREIFTIEMYGTDGQLIRSAELTKDEMIKERYRAKIGNAWWAEVQRLNALAGK